MLKIELFPDPDHCIEKVARRKYARITQLLLRNKDGDKKLEEYLEILRLFLETADFRRLRADSEKQILEGKNVRFVIYLDGGVYKYKMHVT